MKTKRCSKCSKDFPLSSFQSHKKTKDGLNSWCTSCKNEDSKQRKRTKMGMSNVMYQSQKLNSKRRGHQPPDYTLREFRSWLFNHPDFDNLYLNWVKCGFLKINKPSVDRIDDLLPYSFGNIRLVTWMENLESQHTDLRSGVMVTAHKKVLSICLKTGKTKEYHSIAEASRSTGANNIDKVLSGKIKQSGGYIWEQVVNYF